MNRPIPPLFLAGISASTTLLDVVVNISESAAESPQEKIERVVQTFALAGARGGFADSGTRPDSSSMSLVSGIGFEPRKVSFKIRVERVDSGAFQTLRNMLTNLESGKFSISRIGVSDPEKRSARPISVPEITDENQEDLYPGLSAATAVYVDWGSAGSSKSRRFLVELSQPPDAARVAALSDWIKPWLVMLESEAFGMPFDVQESQSFVGSVTQFDEVTVELVIDRFMASEAAWNVLINMIDAFGRKRFPVSRVLID
jgi:hypothetical protein